MPKFQDSKGREWAVELNLMIVRRMKIAGFDLYSIEENGLAKMKELARDDYLLGEWIFANVKPQAETLGVGFEDFLLSLTGDALFDARRAWEDAYRNFIPNPKMRLALEKLRKAGDQIQDEAAVEIDKAHRQLEQIARGRMDRMKEAMTPENLEAVLDGKDLPTPRKSNGT